MGIDGIGKGSRPPPVTTPSHKGAGAAERVRGTEVSRPFEVRADKATPSTEVSKVPAAQPSALERLRAGQIDMSTYLDLKVENATAHLEGLSPGELRSVKSTLRDQIANDPALADLVMQATGSAPTQRED